MPASTSFQLQSVLGSVYTGSSNLLFTLDSKSLISPIGARCNVFPLATTSLQPQQQLPQTHDGNDDEHGKGKGKAKTVEQDAPASNAFDALTAMTRTFNFEMRRPIARMALSPALGSGGGVHLLLVADRDGRAMLLSFHSSSASSSSAAGMIPIGGSITRESVLAHVNFKAPLRDAKFSPNGKFLAVTHKNHVQVWRVPGVYDGVDEQDEQEGVDSSRRKVGVIAPSFTPFELHRTYTGHFDDVLSITWSADSK